MKIKTRFFKSYEFGTTGSITIEDTFVISIVVRKSSVDGAYFISYPSYKTKQGEYKNSAYCLKSEINRAILNHFSEWKQEHPNTTATAEPQKNNVDLSDTELIIE